MDEGIRMAEHDQTQEEGEGPAHQVSGNTVVLASLAGVALGGPLLGMMGFSFLATVALYLISSPLLIIFSPLLFCAGFVFITALAGFGFAGAMAIAGMSTLGWVFRSFRGKKLVGVGGGRTIMDKLIESGGRLERAWKGVGWVFAADRGRANQA